MTRSEVTEAAREDTQQILSFLQSPSARGDAFERAFSEEILYLLQWPYTGHRRRDLTKRDVCFWYFEPYYIVLQIQAETMYIVAVLHSSRDIAKILRKRLKRLQ